MKWTVLVPALILLAGCGSASPKEASDLADEAHAEAERANSRINDLEAENEELRAEVQLLSVNLDSQIADVRADAANEISRLDAAVSELEDDKHAHY